MSYGICNCVRPPSHGRCGGCRIDFGPAPFQRAPRDPSVINITNPGLTEEQVRRIIREEIAASLAANRVAGS